MFGFYFDKRSREVARELRCGLEEEGVKISRLSLDPLVEEAKRLQLTGIDYSIDVRRNSDPGFHFVGSVVHPNDIQMDVWNRARLREAEEKYSSAMELRDKEMFHAQYGECSIISDPKFNEPKMLPVRFVDAFVKLVPLGKT